MADNEASSTPKRTIRLKPIQPKSMTGTANPAASGVSSIPGARQTIRLRPSMTTVTGKSPVPVTETAAAPAPGYTATTTEKIELKPASRPDMSKQTIRLVPRSGADSAAPGMTGTASAIKLGGSMSGAAAPSAPTIKLGGAPSADDTAAPSAPTIKLGGSMSGAAAPSSPTIKLGGAPSADDTAAPSAPAIKLGGSMSGAAAPSAPTIKLGGAPSADDTAAPSAPTIKLGGSMSGAAAAPAAQTIKLGSAGVMNDAADAAPTVNMGSLKVNRGNQAAPPPVPSVVANKNAVAKKPVNTAFGFVAMGLSVVALLAIGFLIYMNAVQYSKYQGKDIDVIGLSK